MENPLNTPLHLHCERREAENIPGNVNLQST